MLTRPQARRAVSGLLVLTTAAAAPVLASGQPALADSVRGAQQWVLDAVDAPSAWPVSQGQGVLVAVIDSGVKPEVSDLAGSVTTGPDYSGVSTPSSDANWGMHGTWMASLIAGHGHGPGGTSGISGVAPQAKILSIRVLPDRKDPAYQQYSHESSARGQRALAQAIRYAVRHGAGVISMSLGYGASSRVVRSALQDATRHDVVVVASSGNSGTTATVKVKGHAPYMFPADYPGVLGVAAVDRSGHPAPFSSDNLSVQIAAPGVKIPAQGSDGQYWLVSGTSPACALTAGVAALIKSVYPHLAPYLVIRAITTSAQNQPAQGYDVRVGFGTLDAAVALTAAGKLTGFHVAGRGISVHTHFGGGRKAVPAAPIGRRSSRQLILFAVIAAACLLLALLAASRLLLTRRRKAARPGPPADQPYQAQPYEAEPYEAQPYEGQPSAALAPGYAGPSSPAGSYPAAPTPATRWSQDQGTDQDRPPGPPPPITAQYGETGPYPPPSPGWPGPASPAGSPSSAQTPPPPSAPAAPPAAAGPGGPSPSGDIPAWLAATPPAGQDAPDPWPSEDDPETTSPSGIPPVRAEPIAAGPPGDSPADPSPPSTQPGSVPPGSRPPGLARPGTASAGSAGPSRYLRSFGRPPPSGRHAARLDPQPAPAWARNRPPGSADDGEDTPDPQDDP